MFAPLAVAALTGWPHSLHVGGGEVTVSRRFRPVVGSCRAGFCGRGNVRGRDTKGLLTGLERGLTGKQPKKKMPPGCEGVAEAA